MRHARHLAILALVLALVVSAGAAGGAPAASKASSPGVKTAFKRLIADTKKVPNRRSTRFIRTRLLRTALRARTRSAKQPCVSVALMSNYRKQLKKLKVKPPKTRAHRPGRGSIRGRLNADSVAVTTALKFVPGTKRCGGGLTPPKVTETTTSVLSSDEKHLSLHISFPRPQFLPKSGGGKDYTQLLMEGMGSAGSPGKPDIPSTTQNFAVPEGANVHITVNGQTSYSIDGVSLFPRQPSSVDGARVPGQPNPQLAPFADRPFTINRGLYNSTAPFPAQPAGGGDLGMLRDVRVGGIELDGAQYFPRQKKLKVLTGLDVTIDFGGDNKGTFGEQRIANIYEHTFSRVYDSMLLNDRAVFDHLRVFKYQWCGEELLIVTSATLRPAADTLAAHRSAEGYSTKVVEVGSGPGQIGTTNTAIQAYIQGQLTTASCFLHPSYVILFGNTANVPTFLVPCGPGGDPAECNIASDLPYSLNGIGSDLFADVQLGRLPSPDLANANALVAKLNTYSTTSPAPPGDDFFSHATTTAYFQPAIICVLNEGASGTPNCDGDHPPVNAHWEIDHANHQDTRGFTITAERAGNAMRYDGYTVDRLYTTDDSDVIPEVYWNGTPIPSHLRRPTFPWDANTTDFLNAYNDGRFLILHRDHGWPDGWAEPTIHSGHVPGLSNGTQLPVVFGVNCASAAFDTPAHPSFVELQVTKPVGGAVAGFGDTRNSPSFPNNHMTLGFFDAMFPQTAPAYGSPVGTRRLGDILVEGKQYMATQEGFEWHGAGDTYVEDYLYHLLGDPTMQMWAAAPNHFDPSRISIEYIRLPDEPINPGDPPPYEVRLTLAQPEAEGTMASLLHNGQLVGRGLVVNGQALIHPDDQTDSSNLAVSLNDQGFIPHSQLVPGTQTKMTVDCGSPSVYSKSTVSGHLDGAPAGSPVKVTVKAPGETTIVKDVLTDKAGDWRAVINAGPTNDPKTWTVDARYAGDSTYRPSSASCSFITDPAING